MTKDNKKKVLLILLGLLFLIGWFYWFQYRPAKIRSDCVHWIKDLPPVAEYKYWREEIEDIRTTADISRYKALYDRCLNEKGL